MSMGSCIFQVLILFILLLMLDHRSVLFKSRNFDSTARFYYIILIYFTSIQIEGFYRIKGCNICVQKSVPLCYNTQNDKVLPISWPNYLPQYKCNQFVIESVIYYIYYWLILSIFHCMGVVDLHRSDGFFALYKFILGIFQHAVPCIVL